MTQPNSVHMTFDTSLIDLNPNASFSTTASDPTSDFPTTQPTPTTSQDPTTTSVTTEKRPTAVQHVPTQDAYDQWAAVYDSDGNMLQSIDDMQLSTLLPEFLAQIQQSQQQASQLSILDLGCGTGRNTLKLLAHAWPPTQQTHITGLDFSQHMLDIAATKLARQSSPATLRLACCDCFPSAIDTNASPFPAVDGLAPVDAVLSTLVLEHIPLPAYFATLSVLLRKAGLALVTNMHAEMGRVSQAGFVNAEGVKVRGSSFTYTVQETVDEAERQGFEVLGVQEREVSKQDVESGRVGKRGAKWFGVKVWYAIVLRKL